MGKEREEKKKERRRGKRGEEYRYSIRAEVESRTSGGGGKEGGRVGVRNDREKRITSGAEGARSIRK